MSSQTPDEQPTNSPKQQPGYLSYLKKTGRVIRDKTWYSLWHFDLFEKVDRCFNEDYYESFSVLSSSQPDYIIDGLWLGSAFNSADFDWLTVHDISIIVNVTPSISNYYPNYFTYHNYDKVVDLNQASLNEYYEKFYQMVKLNPDKNIFVHCFAGRSRSASLIVYYLMREYGWHLDETLKFLRERRPKININVTFLQEIKDLIEKKQAQ